MSSPTPHSSLITLFAKVPESGKVKTRLCPPLSNAEALALHRAFVASSLNLIDKACELVGASAEMCWSHEPADSESMDIPPRFRLSTQTTGDLGSRMHRFVQARLDEGYSSVIIIGSDSPTVPLKHLEQAVVALESDRAPVVLGPSTDGGYYLVGMTRQLPEMFSSIDWGTEHVLRQTREQLTRVGVTPRMLPSWYDIDREADLRRLIREYHDNAQLQAAPLGIVLQRLARQHWPDS